VPLERHRRPDLQSEDDTFNLHERESWGALPPNAGCGELRPGDRRCLWQAGSEGAPCLAR